MFSSLATSVERVEVVSLEHLGVDVGQFGLQLLDVVDGLEHDVQRRWWWWGCWGRQQRLQSREFVGDQHLFLLLRHIKVWFPLHGWPLLLWGGLFAFRLSSQLLLLLLFDVANHCCCCCAFECFSDWRMSETESWVVDVAGFIAGVSGHSHVTGGKGRHWESCSCSCSWWWSGHGHDSTASLRFHSIPFRGKFPAAPATEREYRPTYGL